MKRPSVLLAVVAVTTSLSSSGFAVAEPRWPDQRRIDWLIVHADFSLDPLLPSLSRAARLRDEVCGMLHIRNSGSPIHLYLFKRKSTFEKYVRHYYPTVPSRQALFVKERGQAMVFAYRSPELDTDLRHEMTHAILNSALPVVPLWLDEGLAEYFEVPPARRLAGNSHLRSIDRQTNIASIERLEQVKGLEGMTKRDYRDAWAWVHWMLTGSPEARKELLAYLQGLQLHQVPGPLSQRIRTIFPDAHRRMQRHILYIKTAARRAGHSG